ncbi:DUF397 domain-containing protein [Streptomyces sp. NPDC003077]|uniref:DUF397 domain-containing protein n=1 Tax=Streptomyces sp. NPDC003077 TaxID=3154443 RepID=UPI0033BF174F
MHIADWQTSSHCGEGEACVSVATGSVRHTIRLRESENPEVVLTISRTALRGLVLVTKLDELGPQSP